MQFKEYRAGDNSTEEPLFKTVKGDEMNLTMQPANITTQGFVSDTVKLQQSYHHYNNTNLFVTFKHKYLNQQKAKELGVQHVKRVVEAHP